VNFELPDFLPVRIFLPMKNFGLFKAERLRKGRGGLAPTSVALAGDKRP
jgi:hypothetical protein